MTDGKLLRYYMDESGMSKTRIAERSGFSRERLYRILRGDDARASEMEGLCKTLKLNKAIREKIFFAKEVVSWTT